MKGILSDRFHPPNLTVSLRAHPRNSMLNFLLMWYLNAKRARADEARARIETIHLWRLLCAPGEGQTIQSGTISARGENQWTRDSLSCRSGLKQRIRGIRLFDEFDRHGRTHWVHISYSPDSPGFIWVKLEGPKYIIRNGEADHVHHFPSYGVNVPDPRARADEARARIETRLRYVQRARWTAPALMKRGRGLKPGRDVRQLGLQVRHPR